MRVDAFDPLVPSRALALHTEGQSLAVVVDGGGSWGSGREAADRTREVLALRWHNARQWSVDSVADDIASVASSTPDELRDAEFGWSFSVTCVLATGDLVECLAAGFYRVDVRGPSGTTTLFRPKMLLDELLASGELTPETAASFPHRHVCLGPFVGDRHQVVLTRARHLLAPDEVVIVTHSARHELPDASIPPSAEELAKMARPDAYPGVVVIVRR